MNNTNIDPDFLAALTFEAPDDERFPGLQLAWQALVGPIGTTAVLNAANEVAVEAFFKGSSGVLVAGGLLLLYGPFCDNGVHTAESNAAFDTHLRSIDPAMGVRDSRVLDDLARGQGLEPVADLPLPANNRVLIWRRQP